MRIDPSLPASPKPGTSRSRARWRTIGLNSLFAAGIFGAGIGADRVVLHGGLQAGAADTFTENEDFDVLASTWDLIQNNWVLADETDDTDLIYGAAKGMVDALGDEGHSTFLTPDEAERFQEDAAGEFTGVGIEIGQEDGEIVVIAPIDNSPAIEAGIKSGDTLVAVNGEPVDGLETFEVGDKVRGDAGTSVELTLRRSDGEEYTVDLVRRRIILQPVTWRMLPDGIAQVRIAGFENAVTTKLRQALQEAADAGARGVILDLRDNPGGLMAEAIGVASQFMPEGTTIFQYEPANEEPYPKKTVGFDGAWLEKPLVVLINQGSASAAEIVGAALGDNERAELIGQTTFGTGTVLLPFEQEDGSIVLLGTALWLTADGDQIWKEGVDPDIEVELPADVPVSRPSDDVDVSEMDTTPIADTQLQRAFDEMVEQLADGAAN